MVDETNIHLHVIASIYNKRFLNHVHFCYSDGESHNSCRELPNYCADVLQNTKQGNLYGANVSRLFHYVAKNSEREAQGIKAVEVSSNGKSTVVHHWSRHN